MRRGCSRGTCSACRWPHSRSPGRKRRRIPAPDRLRSGTSSRGRARSPAGPPRGAGSSRAFLRCGPAARPRCRTGLRWWRPDTEKGRSRRSPDPEQPASRRAQAPGGDDDPRGTADYQCRVRFQCPVSATELELRVFESVKVIGSGRVGSAVSARLRERGVAVGEDGQLVLLCVPDSSIAEVAAQSRRGPVGRACLRSHSPVGTRPASAALLDAPAPDVHAGARA